MAFFSESGLTAAGIPLINDNKIRLCDKCGKKLIPVYYEFSHIMRYRCPDGHGEWSPSAEPSEKVIRQPLNAVYQRGAFSTGKNSSGRKRKKPPKKSDFSYLYSE